MSSPLSTSHTRLAGVIGWPVEHSLSPQIQEAGFSALGFDARYLAFAVHPEQLRAAIEGAAALGVIGLNVTVPHKEAVLALCDPDDEARRVGAINTLVFDRGTARPRGLNTDVHGFRMQLAEVAATVDGRRALVLGAGGAARAVTFALLEAGARVTVVARTPHPLAFAASATAGPRSAEVLPWSALAAHMSTADLVVDTTGRGLDAGAPPIDLAPLPDHAVVLDVVVRPTTPLVTAARARGLRALAGEAMLLHQGARSLTAWTGLPAPLPAMAAALREALAQTR